MERKNEKLELTLRYFRLILENKKQKTSWAATQSVFLLVAPLVAQS